MKEKCEKLDPRPRDDAQLLLQVPGIAADHQVNPGDENHESHGTICNRVGAEVRVRLVPSPGSDSIWTQLGILRTAHDEPFGVTVGVIEITANVPVEENPAFGRSDDAWLGCVVAAVYNPFNKDWRATRPVCDRAKEVWGSICDQGPADAS